MSLVTLGVADLDRARRFYCDGLGWTASSVGGDEVVKHLAGLVGSKVEVFLEVTATAADGIPDNIERAVSENARQLKFEALEFEDE